MIAATPSDFDLSRNPNVVADAASVRVDALAELAPVIASLRGKAKASWEAALNQLASDPCVGTYRLSGDLADRFCGMHLYGGWRLAFTFAKDPEADGADVVVIVFLGVHDRRMADRSIWILFHELLGTEIPPSDHDKLPCCNGPMDGAEDAFVQQLASRIRRWDAARRAIPR